MARLMAPTRLFMLAAIAVLAVSLLSAFVQAQKVGGIQSTYIQSPSSPPPPSPSSSSSGDEGGVFWFGTAGIEQAIFGAIAAPLFVILALIFIVALIACLVINVADAAGSTRSAAANRRRPNRRHASSQRPWPQSWPASCACCQWRRRSSAYPTALR